MNRIFILLGLMLAVSGSHLLAQTPPDPRAQQPPAPGEGEIRGAVVDATTGAPIPAASVAVWSSADSSLVTGAMVRKDGSFRIEGLRPGSYYLKVSAIGFETHTSSALAIAAASPRASVGSIKLAHAVVALEGLTVTAERNEVALAPDRNVYTAKSVAPAATTATDVLEGVPSVQVDADGKVSLRGNENVAVQINGRPVPISGAQLAGYLKQLPANTIDRVEVVPNPSAKYDPEGMAGIINIVLQQNVDLGMSGGLTLAASTADRYSAAGNLGYQRGPVTGFLNYGYSFDERQETGINDRTRLGASRSPLSYTEQDITGTAGNDGHNLTGSVDYQLNKRDVLSNALTLNVRDANNASLAAFSEFDSERSPLDVYGRVRDTGSESWMADYTLAFKRTLQPQKHELSAELRYNHSDEKEGTGIWREATAGAGGTRLDAETNDVVALSDQFTAQLDYTRTLARRTKLETGYKGNGRWLDRDFSVMKDPLGTGQWQRSDLSNALEFDETVNAVYGVLSHGVGKVDLQGGLRAEYATRDFALAGAESYPHNYTSLFPSALASFNVGDNSQVKLSYSRRIRRPGTQELNPFPRFFDLQNVFLGNPKLDPEYTDAIELSLQRSGQLGSVQLAPFYRRTTDVIRFVLDTDDVVDGREVTSISFKNLATGTSWGTEFNGQLRLGKKFSGMGGFNVFKMVTEGSGAESAISSDAVTWMAKVNGTYNVTPNTALQAMYMYRAPMAIEGGRFEAMQMANFIVRHKLQGGKMIVVLRLSDPFETMRFRVNAGDDNLIQLTERSFNSRALHLTLQYNWGQAPKIQPQQQPQQEQGPGF